MRGNREEALAACSIRYLPTDSTHRPLRDYGDDVDNECGEIGTYKGMTTRGKRMLLPALMYGNRLSPTLWGKGEPYPRGFGSEGSK